MYIYEVQVICQVLPHKTYKLYSRHIFEQNHNKDEKDFNNLPIIDMDMILWVVMGLIGGSVSLRHEVDRRTDDLGNVPVCPGSVVGLVFS